MRTFHGHPTPEQVEEVNAAANALTNVARQTVRAIFAYDDDHPPSPPSFDRAPLPHSAKPARGPTERDSQTSESLWWIRIRRIIQRFQENVDDCAIVRRMIRHRTTLGIFLDPVQKLLWMLGDPAPGCLPRRNMMLGDPALASLRRVNILRGDHSLR